MFQTTASQQKSTAGAWIQTVDTADKERKPNDYLRTGGGGVGAGPSPPMTGVNLLFFFFFAMAPGKLEIVIARDMSTTLHTRRLNSIFLVGWRSTGRD
jgi:hypothetical protein